MYRQTRVRRATSGERDLVWIRLPQGLVVGYRRRGTARAMGFGTAVRRAGASGAVTRLAAWARGPTRLPPSGGLVGIVRHGGDDPPHHQHDLQGATPADASPGAGAEGVHVALPPPPHLRPGVAPHRRGVVSNRRRAF